MMNKPVVQKFFILHLIVHVLSLPLPVKPGYSCTSEQVAEYFYGVHARITPIIRKNYFLRAVLFGPHHQYREMPHLPAYLLVKHLMSEQIIIKSPSWHRQYQVMISSLADHCDS